METITIICAVAAEFSLSGMTYNVTRKDIGLVLQAPAWIKNTLMFKMLAADGSLKYVTPANKIQMENEPLFGLNAEGKEIKAAEEPKTIVEEAVPEVVAEKAEEPKEEKLAEEPKKTGGRKKAAAKEE